MNGFCRDCLTPITGKFALGLKYCPNCYSPRLLIHEEIFTLSIAHLDCDAFYAAIEKRDNPALRDKPVIVGGGKRGVVATACYIARTYGVHSAMPMFQALKKCPNAVVVKPGTGDYGAAARQIRQEMQALTPLVQPLSIDEAFLDLTGTEKLHGTAPAITLAALALRLEQQVGITVSIGLSHNKFLAKLASDLDKPRGFAIIGKAETVSFLADKPIKLIWGVGAKFSAQLARDGLHLIGDLQKTDATELARRYGENGLRLARLCRGDDNRLVNPQSKTKSISNETTFFEDIRDRQLLEDYLWDLSDKVSLRMKDKGYFGKTITLKLKTANFRSLTRSHSLDQPSHLARIIFNTARRLLYREIPTPQASQAYRLIGVGVTGLTKEPIQAQGSLLADPHEKINATESAIDHLREKFGRSTIQTGRQLQRTQDKE